MTLLDLILIVIVSVSVITGFMAGFARVGIGFIALVAGLLFGFWFYGIPAEWIEEHMTHSHAAANLMGFFAVFLGFMVLGALVGKMLSNLFKWTGLSWVDRFMGGIFGLLRGGALAVIFVAVLMAFTPKPPPNWMVDSIALPYVVDASNMCAKLAPYQIKEAFRDSMFEMRKLWEEEVHKKEKKREQQEKFKKVES